MAVPTVLTKTLAAANAALFAASQTPVSGTALTLTGTGADTQRRVLLTYGDEAAPRTLVITGTTDAGNTISETLAVPSGADGTVATLQDFLTVTSAVPAGGGWTAAVTLGTDATGSTRWVVPNMHITPFELTLGYELVSGAQTATAEQTDDSPLAPLPIYVQGYSQTPPVPTPQPVTGMSGMVANTQSAITGRAAAAVRLTVTAGNGTGTLTIRQSGIAGP
jgi:hypothetical protein